MHCSEPGLLTTQTFLDSSVNLGTCFHDRAAKIFISVGQNVLRLSRPLKRVVHQGESSEVTSFPLTPLGAETGVVPVQVGDGARGHAAPAPERGSARGLAV